jgi:hypothetical protein
MPEGKNYGCSRGNLPAGIDVKGDGGYVVAPPSLHESGRHYQFELEYGLGEIEIEVLPKELQDILDAGQPSAPLLVVSWLCAWGNIADCLKCKK